MNPAETRILVVDDNAENRALAKATLEDEGYQVILATGGDEGIRSFEDTAAQCVLLDVRMPGTDGFAVCAKIRSLPGGADTSIVFLTAQRDVDTFDKALRAGGDDFLTKPVRPTELVLRVEAALKVRRMGEELRSSVEFIRKQRDDLMRLQLQKERLTAFLVHDLKSPVNAMDLHAQVLLGEPGLSPRARASAAHVRDEARTLTRMLRNLLDISKSEEGQLVPRSDTFALRSLVEEIFESVGLKAGAAGIRLDTALEPDTVVADRDLLKRVLENLVDNAIRHGPRGSVVKLSGRSRPGAVELSVADKGPGVPDAVRASIFERYVQLDPQRLGHGLGLAFCKLAVEAQGGTLTVASAEPGSVFTARLPQ